MAVSSSIVVMKRSITLAATSRVTLLIVAIAWPSFCTSLAPMCFSPCAASFSPSDIRRIAARCVPLMLPVLPSAAIGAHPVLHDLRDALGLLRARRARERQLVFVAGTAALRQRTGCTAATERDG